MIRKFNARFWKIKFCTVVCLPLSAYLQFSIAWHQWHFFSHREQTKFQSCKTISPSVDSNWGRDFFVIVVIFCVLIICITITRLNHWHILTNAILPAGLLYKACEISLDKKMKQFIFLTNNVVTVYSDSFRNLFRNPWVN